MPISNRQTDQPFIYEIVQIEEAESDSLLLPIYLSVFVFFFLISPLPHLHVLHRRLFTNRNVCVFPCCYELSLDPSTDIHISIAHRVRKREYGLPNERHTVILGILKIKYLNHQ